MDLRMSSWRRKYKYGPELTLIILMFILCIVAAILLLLYLLDLAMSRLEDEFSSQVLQVSIQAQLFSQGFESGLKLGSKYMELSSEVSCQQFEAFSEPLLLAEEVIATIWVPKIPDTERTSFENSFCTDYYGLDSTAGITEQENGSFIQRESADFYFPIYFISPQSTEFYDFLGLDLASNAETRTAIDYAFANNAVSVSSGIRFADQSLYSIAFSPLADGTGLFGQIVLYEMLMDKIVASSNLNEYTDVYLFDLVASSQILYATTDEYSSSENFDDWKSSILADRCTMYSSFEILGIESREFTIGLSYQRCASRRIIWLLFAGMTVLTLLATLASLKKIKALSRASLLKEENEVLERVDQEKNMFLSSVSHEMRTPMFGILGMVDLLEETKLCSEQSEYVHGIRVCAELSVSLVNDILDFNKIDSGKMEIERIRIVLLPFLRETIRICESKGAEKNITFKIETEGRIPKTLVSDPLRIRQVLLNLFSNAVKFSPANSTITLKISKVNEQFGNYIRFGVVDHGIGIAKENIDAIFLSFKQAEKGTSRLYGGTGLGLPISKKLVKLLGGEIGVKSMINNGSEFFFTIPLSQSASCSEESKSFTPDVDSVRSLLDIRHGFEVSSILVADDNKINRFIIQKFLKDFDHVTYVENGEEAVNASQSKHFDLILMDIQMPIKDGVQGTIEIRRHSNLNRFSPIIGITANAMESDKAAYLKAGMNSVLVKPFSKEELKKCIADYSTFNSVQ